MSVCHIIGAAECFDVPKIGTGDLVIAADGGYDRLLSYGIKPDLLIGDFDSLSSKPPQNIETKSFPVRKDETDMFLAYREGVSRNYTEFYIYGGVGGREDHTLANYSLALYAAMRGHRVRIFGDGSETFVVYNGKADLMGLAAGDGVSVFAFGGTARGVSIKGLSYEADGITLEPSFPLGVSNYSTGKTAFVAVDDGALLVMLRKKS